MKMRKSWNGRYGPPRGRKWSDEDLSRRPAPRREEEAEAGTSRASGVDDGEVDVDADGVEAGAGDSSPSGRLHAEYSGVRQDMLRAYRTATHARDFRWLQRFVQLMRDAAQHMDPDRCRAIAADRRPVDAEGAAAGRPGELAKVVSQLMWEENKTRAILNKAHSRALREKDTAALQRDLELWRRMQLELDPHGERRDRFLEHKERGGGGGGGEPPHGVKRKQPIKLEKWTPQLLESIEQDLKYYDRSPPPRWTPEFIAQIEDNIQLLKDHMERTEDKLDHHGSKVQRQYEPPKRLVRKTNAAGRRLDRLGNYLKELESKAAIVRQAVYG